MLLRFWVQKVEGQGRGVKTWDGEFSNLWMLLAVVFVGVR